MLLVCTRAGYAFSCHFQFLMNNLSKNEKVIPSHLQHNENQHLLCIIANDVQLSSIQSTVD